MIKAVILDVDGVIVGEKIGFNSPYPHTDVIQKLKEIRQNNISISLCTAKPHYSIQKIINEAKLNNLHITNGGGVIIDPLDNVILIKHAIKKSDAINVIQEYLNSNVYTEFYSVDDYFIQQDQQADITEKHTHILQQKPKIVSSLIDESKKQEITKIMPIAMNEEDKKRLIDIFTPFKDILTLSWGVHPVALPLQFGIITAKGISKKEGALEIAKNINVSPKEILGVGDSTSDWQFIQECGYAGAMGNASEELKELVKIKENHHVGGNVDENGILEIFRHFHLIK